MEVNTRIHRLQSGIWSPGLRMTTPNISACRSGGSSIRPCRISSPASGAMRAQWSIAERASRGWLSDPATIIDFPAVIDVARRYVEEAGLLDRIDFIEGNSLDVQWPQDQDVILMSYLVSAIPVQNHPTVLNGPGTLLPVAASS